ncbi:hypothetical protein [Paucibacter sp. KBW04]|uniref:hypothetical protein n=1 Tax=Paucibacter sp. KBW04 TaxID=2153361 RepID=UPI000F5688A7|nr:hypothetical protein [Paucibacter sp. KBW04]
MSHWVANGKLERQPAHKHDGVRILFTDLHLLGSLQSKPEQYIAALVAFIRQLINPSKYLIVFWSAYPEEAENAWQLLVSRLKAANSEDLIPFDYRVLDKTEVKNISDEDENISSEAKEKVKADIEKIFTDFPQLRSFMLWESCASRAASATSNELIRKLDIGGIPFTNGAAVKDTMKRMAQETLGRPHAPNAPTKGVYLALTPIAQDWLNKEAAKGALDSFLELTSKEKVSLPKEAAGKPKLTSLLNDFFIHSEQSNLRASERGAVILLDNGFLEKAQGGLVDEIGLADQMGDWREALCIEFAHGYSKKTPQEKEISKGKLNPGNVYVTELSADCDYAQDKTRSHRFLLSLFVPTDEPKPFYQNGSGANDSIYITPEITLGGVSGRLMISCRIFLARPYRGTVEGAVVSRMRQEVLSELAHHYSTHMRRPGKVAFF